jgi:hypothetical protein
VGGEDIYIYIYIKYTNDICFMPEGTEYFIHQRSEVDGVTRACDSRCAEASKTKLSLFVSVTLVSQMNSQTCFIQYSVALVTLLHETSTHCNKNITG